MKVYEIKRGFLELYKVSLYISENDKAFFPEDFENKDYPFCELDKSSKLISKKMSLSLYNKYKDKRIIYFGSSDGKAEGDFFILLYGEDHNKHD